MLSLVLLTTIKPVAVDNTFSSLPVTTSAYFAILACDMVMGAFASTLNAVEYVHQSVAAAVVCATTLEKDLHYTDIFDSAPI